MHTSYSDIRSRIDESPTWFDSNGTPRYGEFKPEMLGVYDHYAVLIKIECQSCRRPLLVGAGYPRYGFYFRSLEKIVDGYHYGDPPAHGCVGDTMNCVDRLVMEAWQTGEGMERWVRVPEFEGRDLTPDWAEA